MHRGSATGSIRDVGFTVPTLFNEQSKEIDRSKMADHVEFLQSAGARFFIPCGNTGEYDSLSVEERKEVVEITSNKVDGECTVVAGVGGSLETIFELMDGYESAGVDGIMVKHPYHTFTHEEGLKQYYREIANATSRDVIIYKRSHDVPDDVILDVAGIDNIVGVKYAVDDIASFSQSVRKSSDDLVWITGIAERYAPSYALEGAEGFTTGIGNFLPHKVLELMEALREDDWERAKRIRDDLRPFEELREKPGKNNSLPAANNVPTVKYGMELTGKYGGPVRPPLVDLSEEDKQRTAKYLEKVMGEKTTSV